ncbi:cysteine-tryptophan domain-containing zinc finger protein 5-like isoform X2 [Phragmites australis]|uniref:cysteine-tryptophan domain-containing zinc finger protein 5-like isoform X2 n=1 Tax=Phragmites australis TaxID=29695 RepID=UPI002D7834A9|nr:cysteine-tryptophan domain-containing zinc finger protein 5-like isoform X2 [Phragmites australis]
MLLDAARRSGREEEVARRRRGMGYEEGELELEEGEAAYGGCGGEYGYGGCGSGYGYGGGELVDPDALTYIDVRLQNLLGCFQKKFEGEISAEHLGSQYGSYGSFLPTYLHSPLVLSQSRSSAVPLNHGSASRSPYVPTETAQKNHFVKTALDSSRKNDHCRISNESNGNPSQQMLNRGVDGPKQKAPKIRIKVNINRSLARNTAAIYSGLGLDISPSSSMEGSLDGSAGAPVAEVLPDESPSTIFQIMACHSVPGGLLLSPLAGNVLELREKPKAIIEKHEAPELQDDKAELRREWGYTTSATLDNKNQMAKEIKSDEKKGNIPVFNSSKCRFSNPSAVNTGIKPQLQDISDDTGSIFLPRIIKTEHSVEESAKFMSENSDQLKETKDDTLKGHISNKNKEIKKEPSLDHGFSVKSKYDSDEYNSQPCASSSHLQNIPNKTTSLERDKGQVVHVKDELSEYKSKVMGSLLSAESMYIITENVDRNSSGMIKVNKKKTSSSQAALSRKKVKVKAHKQLNDDITRKSYGEDESYSLDHRIDLTSLYPKDKKMKHEKETITSGETGNKSGGGNDVEHKIYPLFVDRSDPMPSACKNGTAELTAPEPVVINEQWVCCDKCEKWRLLPYGMNPDILPKKWRCSMQSWLPGMSSCKISEDETTRALRTLYMVPAPENSILDGPHDNATSGIGTTTAPTFEGNIQSTGTSGKLKGSHDGANATNNLDLAGMSKPSKKLHAHSSRRPDGVDCFPKLKERRKHIESSDKGENVAKDRTHPMKSSVGVDHDNLRPSKKIKKESNEPAKHRPPEFVISKNSPSANETPNNMHKNISISPGMGKYGSPSSGKRFHSEDICFSDGVVKTSDAGKSDLPDLSIKKKKFKQRQLSQRDPDPSDTAAKYITKRTLSESNVVKEKPRPELKLSKTDRIAEHARGTVAGVDDHIYAEKECLSEQHQENSHCQYPLLSESSTRRNVCHTQTSTAATSSSSKVSNSHKSKTDFQETRASPVESVSSSPLRTSDKNPLDQHRRYSWAVADKRKYDFGSDSEQAKARVSGCFNGDTNHHVLKDEDVLKDKQDLTNACLKNEDSGLCIKNGQLNLVTEQKVDSDALSLHDNQGHKHLSSHQNVKTAPHFNSNQSDHANLTCGNVKSDKGNIQSKDLKINPSSVKGSNQHPSFNNASNGDASYKAKQLEKAVIENLVTRKQATHSGDASNPINASVLLKEARDLKHLSKRLKEKGDDFESTSMCFEAALKFLHVASLCEAPNIDSSKQVDTIQAMKLYSETGNLCGFCAHEFERLKKMANAALAYKCVEVAYMKAAFFIHPGAVKDRHALQTASLMVPPDVDNLNNQSTVAKAVSARGVYSQIASNPISRNNHHLMGLLAYAEDINNAFEGTRKSQNLLSAYLSGIGKDQVDGVALLREVLDFSFHNVKGLLQLIRNSLEYINHESVK